MKKHYWYKSRIDKFDDPRMKILRTYDCGNNAALILEMFSVHAARFTSDGVIKLTKKCCTAEDLGIIFGFDEGTMYDALIALEECGYITRDAYGTVALIDWGTVAEKEKKEKKQNQKNNEKTKNKEKNQKKKEKEKIQEKQNKKEKEAEKERVCTDVQALFHSICISFPKIEMLSVDQKCAIRKLLRQMPLEKLKLCFERAEESRFLRHNGWATFDWLIKYDNAVKVLNGNYANDRTVEDERESETFNSFDEDEFITAAMQRGFAI